MSSTNAAERQLDNWLDKHNARCMWQTWTQPRKKGNVVECWTFANGSIAIIMRYSGGGWDIYPLASPQSNLILDVFKESELRLGLKNV